MGVGVISVSITGGGFCFHHRWMGCVAVTVSVVRTATIKAGPDSLLDQAWAALEPAGRMHVYNSNVKGYYMVSLEDTILS